MKYLVTLLCIFMAITAHAMFLEKECLGWDDGKVRVFKKGNFTAVDYDLTYGEDKVWEFNLPTNPLTTVKKTYSASVTVPGYEEAIITQCIEDTSAYYSRLDHYYSASDQDYYYLGYPNPTNGSIVKYAPGIDMVFPRYLDYRWTQDHDYTVNSVVYGTYSVAGDVVAAGTVSLPLGTFEAQLLHKVWSSGETYMYDYYEWVTREYGIVATAIFNSASSTYELLERADRNLVCDFEADVTQGHNPLTVQFTSLSSGEILTYAWDFDDDGTIDSTLENPSYTYNEAGVYTVSLVIANDTVARTRKYADFIDVELTATNDINASSGNYFKVYPNPFNPTTCIAYQLPEAGIVNLSIYNLRGKLVYEQNEHRESAGEHSFVWHGTDNSGNTCPTGVYFVRLVTANKTYNQKILMLK